MNVAVIQITFWEDWFSSAKRNRWKAIHPKDNYERGRLVSVSGFDMV